MSLVIGVMSTFNPDSSVATRALEHIQQLDQLIVVDDGSQDSSALELIACERISIIKLDTNSGIAAALNLGTKRAIQKGADYVLHLDQDSLMTEYYVLQCLNTFLSASETTCLGIVIADYVNDFPAIPPRYSPEGFGLVDEGIQSGMMVSAKCINDIGLLDERLFIDCVDTEFCLRAREFGWNIGVAPKSKILHTLGTQIPFSPFGKTISRDGEMVLFQYHPPFRQYYIVRNNVDLCLRYMRKRPRWVISVIRREFVPQIKSCIGSGQMFQHLIACFWGITHGLTRRRGKIPNWMLLARSA